MLRQLPMILVALLGAMVLGSLGRVVTAGPVGGLRTVSEPLGDVEVLKGVVAGGGSLSGDELGEQDAAVFNLDRRAPKRTSTKTKTKKKTSTKTTKAVKRTSTKTKTTKTKSKTPGPKTTKAIASATTHTVLVGTPGSSFSPSTLTINKGDSVLWSWVDGFHSVSQTTGATCDFSGFDSGVDGAPKTFVRNFTQTATVHYACQPHCFSGMQGKIIVT